MSWYLCVFIPCLPSKTMCALRERAMSVTSPQVFLPPEQWFACKGCLIGLCYSFARVLVWSLGKQTHAMCCEMVFHFNVSENQLWLALFLKLKYSWFIMLCYFQVYNKVIQFYIYIKLYIFQILFHFNLLQVIEYSSLCYWLGLCCLSILYIVVYIC